MKKGVFLLPLFLLFLKANLVFANISVRDDTNQVITLKNPATRIISLAPNITEILFFIDAGNDLVGKSSSNDIFPGTESIPIIATNNLINIESLFSLKPQLVVAWLGGNPRGQLDELKKLGIPVYFAKFNSIENIEKTMRNLALLAGTNLKAKQNIQQFSQQFKNLQTQYRARKKIKVYYEIWHEPLFTVSKRSIISEVISLCGGKNVFANTLGIAPQITIESVIAAKPEVILTSSTNFKNISYWQKWPEIPAVKNKQIYSIPADEIERPGPRIILGAKKMCEFINNSRVD